ncbi:glycosyltransferase family 2 protein [Flavobacterium beibuense]|uniref:Glycosyl transferase, group 2 family protein n=1 Tax=Flavobacterium beibuense TaxID=657326 RepID=A0A444W7K9_9FLAO|nr:glycosyltransferase family 2 protein [Flavobacterium beibuense]RYJ41752.1 Glycosyl transferase, group 2 family protein [Flavobacterium beibuense]
MQLSVIILNYNVRYFLEQCVLSVQKALKDIDGEIIVVDNNSPDDSCAMMKQRFPEVTLIENKDNAGFPKGNNIGVAAAKGEYICILNPDTVVAEDTFKKVLEFAKSKTNLGIIGVKLVDGRGNFLPESKRGVPTPWVAFTKIAALNKAFSKSLLFNKYYAQHLSEDETGEVDILVGAFMVMKRELYLEVGGFDEGCFMYSDDIDLSYTVQQKGKTNYYFHETTVIHYKGESTVKDGTYMKRFREAMQFFYKKHFRSSPVFDLFMRAGTLFFALAKQKKKASVIVPDSYILLSDNEDLRTALELSLEKKVERHEKDFEKLLISQSISVLNRFEVIFDNETLDFFEIIKLMGLLKNSGLTFKIKPEGSNFIIGSNDSNDRGTVIVIKS